MLLFWAPNAVIFGDPPIYLERLEAIIGGTMPYRDPGFEHLPGALIPILAAWLLSGFGPELPYTIAFSLLMLVCLGVTYRVLDRTGTSISGLAPRWLALAAPLVPLVVFRNDPWVVMLAVVAMVDTHPERVRITAAVAAVLSKGWPVALAPAAWWEGRRRTAAWIAGAAGLTLTLMLSPGFRATQEAAGLHSETLGGALVGLARALGGGDLGINWTTAAYLDAPLWAYGLGPAVAVVLAALAWRSRRVAVEARGRWLLVGILTVAILMASRLFSTQYVLWITPFVAAASSRTRALAFAAGGLSLASVLGWWSLFDGAVWWWATVAIRNLLLVWVGIRMASEARDLGSQAGRHAQAALAT
jgi:hypothetical protein